MISDCYFSFASLSFGFMTPLYALRWRRNDAEKNTTELIVLKRCRESEEFDAQKIPRRKIPYDKKDWAESTDIKNNSMIGGDERRGIGTNWAWCYKDANLIVGKCGRVTIFLVVINVYHISQVVGTFAFNGILLLLLATLRHFQL